jgi:PWWP domain
MDLSKDLQPGVVVFGRVRGYPWWPAVVACAPKTSEWVTKDGRVWCLFFNDRTGAWLRTTELRPFDAFHREECMVINRGNKGHRKFIDRIVEAITCAISYTVTLPSSPEDEEPVSTLAPWAREEVRQPASAATLRGQDPTSARDYIAPLTSGKETSPPSEMTDRPAAETKPKHRNRLGLRFVSDPGIGRPLEGSAESPDGNGLSMTRVTKKRDRALIKKEDEFVENTDSRRKSDHGMVKARMYTMTERRARESAPAACLDVGR